MPQHKWTSKISLSKSQTQASTYSVTPFIWTSRTRTSRGQGQSTRGVGAVVVVRQCGRLPDKRLSSLDCSVAYTGPTVSRLKCLMSTAGFTAYKLKTASPGAQNSRTSSLITIMSCTPPKRGPRVTGVSANRAATGTHLANPWGSSPRP